MRSKTRLVLAGALAALCAATVSLVIIGRGRDAWLKETGETRRSVVGSATRLLPARARTATEAGLRAAAEQLARERYVARLWLVDTAGHIVFQRNGPGREGESVDQLAPSDFAETLRGLTGAGLTHSQRTQLLAMAAQRRDGDHNDVFKPLVLVVRSPEGDDAAFVVLSYDVNPEMGGPSGLVLVAIVGLAVYWAGLVAWVFVDARSRGESSILWALLVLFTNLVGVLAYLLAARPRRS